jgi:hypothetical protein
MFSGIEQPQQDSLYQVLEVGILVSAWWYRWCFSLQFVNRGFSSQGILFLRAFPPLQASTEEIKQAWKKQALLTHPDRHQTNQNETNKQRFLDIQHAYEVLKDPILRAEYDKELLHRLYLEVRPNSKYLASISLPSFIPPHRCHKSLIFTILLFCRNILVAFVTWFSPPLD